MKKDKNIRIEYYKSSGPGGQHKNKTATAVRARHLTSGITAIATEHRSQARNHALALKRLKEKILKSKRKKKPRIPIRIPASVKKRILEKKKKRSKTKKLRRKVGKWNED